MKSEIKSVIQAVLPSRYAPILVASIGRSGSTLVHTALCDGMAATRFGPFSTLGWKVVCESAWDLQDQRLRRGTVYKTHALAHELPAGSDARVVFLFAKPSDAARSVVSCRQRYGLGWIEAHFEHLRASGPFEALAERDVLRIEEQIDGWLGLERTPVLALRYETLWENVDVLAEFVGLPVSLPAKRPRAGRNDVDDTLAERIVETYSTLDKKVEALPDVVLLEGDQGGTG